MKGPSSRVLMCFVLAMWVTLAVWIAKGDWSGLNWAMLAVAALLTAIIFVDFVAVFGIGYAACMITLPVVVLATRGLTTAGAVVGGLTFLYGVRLLVFVVRRRRSSSFSSARAGEQAANTRIPTAIKALMFVLVASVQTFEAMPTYVAASVGETSAVLWVGATLMAVGLVIEAVADQQKQIAKQADAGALVRRGLFARTRHPNYTGEIVFQVGLAVSALGMVTGWWQVLAVVVAPTYLAILMWFQAKAGDERLERKHGDDPEWAAYLAASGSLLPALGRPATTTTARDSEAGH